MSLAKTRIDSEWGWPVGSSRQGRMKIASSVSVSGYADEQRWGQGCYKRVGEGEASKASNPNSR